MTFHKKPSRQQRQLAMAGQMLADKDKLVDAFDKNQKVLIDAIIKRNRIILALGIFIGLHIIIDILYFIFK